MHLCSNSTHLHSFSIYSSSGAPELSLTTHDLHPTELKDQLQLASSSSSSRVGVESSAVVVPSLSTLTAGLSQATSKQDSDEDDDYDEES